MSSLSTPIKRSQIRSLNGLTLIRADFPHRETASVGVFIKIGSRHEQPGVLGIAHFLEHMLFKGSKNYSYKQIKGEIESTGGALNGFTSHEVTAYYAQCLRQYAAKSLDILLDMVFSPTLNTNEITKERNVILEEVKMHKDLPHMRSASLLERLLWPNHPLGNEIIGTKKTIAATSRNDLVSFRNAHYVPPNIVVCCTGNISEHSLVYTIKKKMPKQKRFLTKKKMFAPQPLEKTRILVEKKDISQTHLCFGFRAPSYISPDRYIVDLIHIVLGANMSSRLFEVVRDQKGLCYDIGTDVRKYYDSGAFVVHVGLDEKNVLKATRCIYRELRNMTERGVTQPELSRAKDFLIGQVTMNLERPQGKMFYCADSYISLGRIYSLSQIKKAVADISRTDMRRLSRAIFNTRNHCISCVTADKAGAQKAIEKAYKAYA